MSYFLGLYSNIPSLFVFVSFIYIYIHSCLVTLLSILYYATKHKVSKACNKVWGVKGTQPSMRHQKYETKNEVSRTSNQVWGVKKQPSMRCQKHVIKRAISHSHHVTPNQAWWLVDLLHLLSNYKDQAYCHMSSPCNKKDTNPFPLIDT